jgi:hypothetical protein
LGEAFVPGADELTPEILEYIAPEVFLKGVHEPSGDVYSLGLVLYAILNAGRLPFLPEKGDFSADDRARATQKRVKGETVPPPKGKHPTELVVTVQHAVNISPDKRFRNTAEFREALVNCDIENFDTHAAISDVIDEQKLFDKPYAEFTAMERLMAEIISSSVAVKGSSAAAGAEPAAKSAPHEWRAPWKAHVDGADKEKKTEQSASGLDEKVRRRSGRNRLIFTSIVLLLLIGAVIAAVAVSLRDSGLPERDLNAPPTDGVTASATPPDTQIVVPPSASDTGDEAPLASGQSGNAPATDSAPPESAQTPPVTTPAETPDEAPKETASPKPLAPDAKYEVVMADISWSEAKKQAAAKGGHLVTVNSETELNQVIDLIDGTNARFVWLGAKRDEAGEWVWDYGDASGYYKWAKGEPSVKDVDGTPEDYLMLVRITYKSEWFYNDCPGDPAGQYPKFYAGKTAYIIEYE